MSVDMSKYTLYSLGTAAEDKPLGDFMLWCTPKEQLNMLDGVTDTTGQATNVQGTDADGKAYAGTMVTGNAVHAEWVGVGESNRRTAPNVANGEEVFIYTYADTGKFFWTPRNTNTNHRTFETVAYAWAASPGSKAALSPENSYYLEVSTHTKKILLTTSQMNGEVTTHTIEVNPGIGELKVADASGNEVTWNSEAHSITLINSEDVEIEMIGADLNVTVPAGDMTETVGGQLTINVTGDAAVKAATATVTSSLNTLNGDTVINGMLTVTKETLLGADLVVGGFSVLNGGASSPNPITAPNI